VELGSYVFCEAVCEGAFSIVKFDHSRNTGISMLNEQNPEFFSDTDIERGDVKCVVRGTMNN
jgi:hypothetical protein